MSADVMFAAGANFIQHRDGHRLTREEAIACRAYFERVLADRSALSERHDAARERIGEIDLAIAASFSNQQKDVA